MIMGLGFLGILGLYRDNGKENGNLKLETTIGLRLTA